MDNIAFFIQSLVAFFVVIDSIGNVPIFISLLDSFREDDRKQIIKKASRIAMLTLIIVTFTGNWIFYLLNITMYSFKVAGGILLLIISIEMLFGKKSKTETSEDIEEKKHDITVTPLAIPLLTGPGALTTGIVLFDNTGWELGGIIALPCKHPGSIPYIILYTDKGPEGLQIPWKNRDKSSGKGNGDIPAVNSNPVHHRRRIRSSNRTGQYA